MTVHHRLHLQADIAGPILDSFGLSFPANPSASEGYILIPDIAEDDPLWPRLALFLKEYHRAWVADPSMPITSRATAVQETRWQTSLMPNSATRTERPRRTWLWTHPCVDFRSPRTY